MSDSLRDHGQYPTRLFCSWDFPGQNAGVGCHFLLQGSTCHFLTQGSNPGLPHCGQTLQCVSHQEIQRFPDNQSSFSGTGPSSPSGVWYSAFCTALHCPLSRENTSEKQWGVWNLPTGCLESTHTCWKEGARTSQPAQPHLQKDLLQD